MPMNYFDDEQIPDRPRSMVNRPRRLRPIRQQTGLPYADVGTVMRAKWRQSRTGWSPALFDAVYESQGCQCAICGRKLRRTQGKIAHIATAACADHDHDLMQPRGVLCSGCNRGLGAFKDRASLLRKAAAYLDHHLELAAIEIAKTVA